MQVDDLSGRFGAPLHVCFLLCRHIERQEPSAPLLLGGTRNARFTESASVEPVQPGSATLIAFADLSWASACLPLPAAIFQWSAQMLRRCAR